ncbi:MAG: redoxin domain-containing protein [Candidatus Thorarchaeota archaeon]|nr:redoxin domain-containing protein [Candidatus Thorarchaeota archaeon]
MLLRERNVCLTEGEQAPDFCLLDQHGEEVELSEFRGKKNVLLVLHPGELNEACTEYIRFYKNHLEDFEHLDTQVLAINMDSVESNREWIEEIGGLGFSLLSDYVPLGDITLKYDCFVPEKGYGKRVIFLVDKEGVLRHIEVLSGKKGVCPDLSSLLNAIRKIQ